MKQLLLQRFDFRDESTISHLFLDGSPFCDICEDKDRGLDSKMSLAEIKRLKVPGKTAIPYGEYEIIITYSPRFKKNLPLLLKVPGYEGVRMHPGNTHKDTDGCLLPGKDSKNGTVYNSKYWFNKLMPILEKALKTEKVFIKITK